MDQQESEPTVLKGAVAGEPGADSEQPTVVHADVAEEETRRSGDPAQSPIPSAGDLDPPTRLMVASARRMQEPSQYASGSLIRKRFRLEKQIGRGGMGVVYTARDLRKEELGDTDSLIAIKLLSEDFKDHPESLRMLQQETRKTQQLAHPNIVTVYDFDRDGDDVYMTMEYLSGRPLTHYIREHEHQPGTLDEVMPIIRGIVDGLSYAHQQGIVHSDLKPGNIMITDNGVTKILDFGIARAVMVSELPGRSDQAASPGAATQPVEPTAEPEKVFALTPRYASPEMFENARPDPRDDIYALACIAYQLLSGDHPYNGLPANRAMQEGLKPDPVPGLTERQWKGLLAGLSFEREQRTASADEFLTSFLPKRKEPWRWATAGVGLIGLAIAIYYGTRPPLEAPLNEADRAVVNQQIEVARQHMEFGNLGVALENYKMILALPPYDQSHPGGDFIQHPHNSMATEDLKTLLQSLALEAEQALAEMRPEDAMAFVRAGLDVDPDHSALLDLKGKIEKSK